jgi:hypothetical protein
MEMGRWGAAVPGGGVVAVGLGIGMMTLSRQADGTGPVRVLLKRTTRCLTRLDWRVMISLFGIPAVSALCVFGVSRNAARTSASVYFGDGRRCFRGWVRGGGGDAGGCVRCACTLLLLQGRRT